MYLYAMYLIMYKNRVFGELIKKVQINVKNIYLNYYKCMFTNISKNNFVNKSD
jgi:hypothetical protein